MYQNDWFIALEFQASRAKELVLNRFNTPTFPVFIIIWSIPVKMSESESTKTRQWMKFFLGAGIPSENAAQYAVTFTENRMGLHMLLDLDKDILRFVRYLGICLCSAMPWSLDDIF